MRSRPTSSKQHLAKCTESLCKPVLSVNGLSYYLFPRVTKYPFLVNDEVWLYFYVRINSLKLLYQTSVKPQILTDHDLENTLVCSYTDSSACMHLDNCVN